MWKRIILAFILISFGLLTAFFVYKSEPRLNKNFENEKAFFQDRPFRLGLDLSGGIHLVYDADVSQVAEGEVGDAMESLRDVIERRVNLFGVSEPIVQVQRSGFVTGEGEKLIVDLPGVTDIDQAIEMIGQTPLLEFKTQSLDFGKDLSVDNDGNVDLNIEDSFVSSGLTGRYLKKATLEFNPNTGEPIVALQFDDEGAKLFADITKNNIGKMVAIYLDGSPLSTPVVQDEIRDGQAIISGSFDPNEAKQLAGRLNSGALPVPITLVSKQTVGATLGEDAINKGVTSAIIGFIMISAFFLLWYRVPGILAVLALSFFVVLVLALFKLIPVTLTTAGIAGFIISMGIAVDANVLIFERIKEEMKNGRVVADAVSFGFERAWFSIRDSNISTLITSIILFWFGSSLIKGFALTLGIGVLVSMFSSIVFTKVLIRLLSSSLKESKVLRFLFSSGFSK